jgi:hypothetical protein
MLRFALSTLSVIALGALTAGLLHVVVPAHTTDPQPAYLGAAISEVVNLWAKPAAIPAAVSQGVENALSAMVPGFAPRDPAPKIATVLLNQDVSVLDGAQQAWRELPKGTNVQVLAARGRFVEVQHAGSVITVPRTVIQSGISKTN